MEVLPYRWIGLLWGPCGETLGTPRGNSFSSSHHSRRLQPLKTINGHMILLSGLPGHRNYAKLCYEWGTYCLSVYQSVCLSVRPSHGCLVCLSVCHVCRCLLSALVEHSLHSNDFNEIFNSQQREFIVLSLKLCTLWQLHVVWPLKNKHPTRVESTRGESSRLKCCEVL